MEKTELRVRLAMARAAVQTLERMIQAGECDAAEGADALTHYRAQLAELERLADPPAPVVIGLKTATLFGKTK